MLFYFSYHFCYNLTFYLYAFQPPSPPPFFLACVIFFSCNRWYLMGFVWGFVFIAFDLGALHGIAEGEKN